MKILFHKRYIKPFLAWIALFAFLLLSFVVVSTVETLTREYPKWHWWMSSVPINVFSDAFLPVVNFAVSLFSIPIGIITLLPILAYDFHWVKYQRLIEIICYILSIGFLWLGFWITGFMADCTMLSLQSDGGPWGPCGYWAWFSRPPKTFIWHAILWVIWSVVLIGLWKILKSRLLSNGKDSSLLLQAA